MSKEHHMKLHRRIARDLGLPLTYALVELIDAYRRGVPAAQIASTLRLRGLA